MDLILVISSCGCRNLVLVLLSIWAIQDSPYLKRVQALLLVLRCPYHSSKCLGLVFTLLDTSQDLEFEPCLFHHDKPMKILSFPQVLEHQICSLFCTSQDLEFDLCLFHLDKPMQILFSPLVLEYHIIVSSFCTHQDQDFETCPRYQIFSPMKILFSPFIYYLHLEHNVQVLVLKTKFLLLRC